MESNETWKDVKGYEGIYLISDCGRIKSLSRLDSIGRPLKEKILKLTLDRYGYLRVNLSKNNTFKTNMIHKIVAINFLNHIPNGLTLVVNHKDFNRQNNNLDNLEIVTVRENSNRKHLKSSSKYTGVYWRANRNKWVSQISVDGKTKYLGSFINEFDASEAYELALSKLKN